MGTSFVEFEENAFWTADAWLQVWLSCLVVQANKLVDVPIWLREWQNQAHINASNHFSGCVCAGLNDFITTEEQRLTMIDLCEQATQEINKFGVNAAKMEVAWVESQSDINEVVIAGVLSVRDAFIRLLQRQSDEYDRNNRRNWKLNQVAPLNWWRGQEVL